MLYNSNMIPEIKSRSKQLLDAIRLKYPNYHPLIAIAEIAHSDQADLELQFQCHKTIAKYIEPELKAIEVKNETSERSKVTVTLFGEAEIEDAQLVPSPQIQNW